MSSKQQKPKFAGVPNFPSQSNPMKKKGKKSYSKGAIKNAVKGGGAY